MATLLLIGTVVSVIIRVYTLVLWGRFVLDWVMVLNRAFRPRGALAVLTELIFTLTDPPLKFFRRVLPPIRLGQVQLDLGWMLTMLVCWILLAFIPSYV